VVRAHHPFEGQELAVLGWMRRHGSLELCLVLPDGSKSLIPATWTDLGGSAERSGEAATLGSLSDLLCAAAVVSGLVHRFETANRDHRPTDEKEVGRATEPVVVGGRNAVGSGLGGADTRGTSRRGRGARSGDGQVDQPNKGGRR
jgi:hypothetical protein